MTDVANTAVPGLLDALREFNSPASYAARNAAARAAMGPQEMRIKTQEERDLEFGRWENDVSEWLDRSEGIVRDYDDSYGVQLRRRLAAADRRYASESRAYQERMRLEEQAMDHARDGTYESIRLRTAIATLRPHVAVCGDLQEVADKLAPLMSDGCVGPGLRKAARDLVEAIWRLPKR